MDFFCAFCSICLKSRVLKLITSQCGQGFWKIPGHCAFPKEAQLIMLGWNDNSHGVLEAFSSKRCILCHSPIKGKCSEGQKLNVAFLSVTGLFSNYNMEWLLHMWDLLCSHRNMIQKVFGHCSFSQLVFTYELSTFYPDQHVCPQQFCFS